MNLNEYPQAIFKAAEAVNNLEADIFRLKLQISRIEGAIDAAIATDSDLKNEALRKASRFIQLTNHLEHSTLQVRVIDLIQQKSNATAYLEMLRNEFSCLKLSTRQGIATQLEGVDSRDLVGL